LKKWRPAAISWTVRSVGIVRSSQRRSAGPKNSYGRNSGKTVRASLADFLMLSAWHYGVSILSSWRSYLEWPILSGGQLQRRQHSDSSPKPLLRLTARTARVFIELS